MRITAIGEILVDMTQTHTDENGIPHFAANPGGAPANVAVAVAKLGGEAAFIGCVGDDLYGRLLRETLHRNGVCADGLQKTDQANTTLAIVMVDEKGERSFSFRISTDNAVERNAQIYNEEPFLLSFFPSGNGRRNCSVITVDEPSVILSSLRKCNGQFVATLYNASDKAVTASICAANRKEPLKVSFGKHELKFIKL